MGKPRLLLADDHRIVIEGLRSILETEFDLVGTAGDGRTLLAEAARHDPDVIVVDISMPLLNGIEAARQLRKSHPRAKIIVLTMHDDLIYANRALEAGAVGYVLKHSAPVELVTAIREALAGRIYVTPSIAKKRPSGQKVIDPLTPRQREVLQLVAEGHSAKEIASVLHISSRTVEFHKYRIMEDLQLHSNAELVQYAIKHGIAAV